VLDHSVLAAAVAAAAVVLVLTKVVAAAAVSVYLVKEQAGQVALPALADLVVQAVVMEILRQDQVLELLV
jgi:hypothetical protein